MKLFGRAPPHPKPGSRPPPAIREADSRDLDGICACLNELVADRVPRRGKARYLQSIRDEQREMLIDPKAAWFVAARGEDVIGCARVDIHQGHPLLAYLDRHDYGYVFGLFVREEERSSGTGERLLARCEQWIKAHGARYMFLHSTPEAIRFYEKMNLDACLEFGKKL